MTKTIHDDVYDGALDIIKNNCTKITVCSQPPTTYTEGLTTFALADVTVTGTDFTHANGDVSGRKTTVGAQSTISVDTTGNGNHVALLDVSNTKLLGVTPTSVVRSNTAQAGASSTITLDASASASDDFYNNMAVVITGGTGIGQTRMISDYVGSTKVATVSSAWGTNPDSSSTFSVYGQALTSGNTVDLAAFDIELEDPTP